MSTQEFNNKGEGMEEIEEREMEINGVKFVGTIVKTTDGVDEEGNPKVSIKVNVPSTAMFGTPGKVE